jgi:hypothetical protein
MPIHHILMALRAERDKLNRAIEALQGPTRRSGRPPKNPLLPTPSIAPAAPTPNHKGRMSVTARKAQSERMREY